MKRLALIVAAPLVIAVVLALTSIYRPGSGGAENEEAAPATDVTASAALVAEPPANALVLGDQAGDLAVGLAVRHAQPEQLQLEATVLGPDGTGVQDLDVVFAAAGQKASAEPCGDARYCAKVATKTPTRVTVCIEGDPGSEATFDIPQSWRPGGALIDKATQVYTALETLTYEERLSSGAGTTLNSSWEMAAPDRLSYVITDGASAVVIGTRRWDRAPGGRWIESPQDPLPLPEPPWTSAIESASILGSERVRGRDAWIVSFLDQAGLPAWFTLWIDKETSRTLELSMTTAAHFMQQTYTAFDQPLAIVPPR